MFGFIALSFLCHMFSLIVLLSLFRLNPKPVNMYVAPATGEKPLSHERKPFFTLPVNQSQDYAGDQPLAALILRICTASGSTSLPSTRSLATNPTIPLPANNSFSS